jgi:hypothetical protein
MEKSSYGKDKKISVTFSLPIILNNKLHTFVEKRELSLFVSKAIEKALEEEQKALMTAYAASNDDPDRKEVIEDWSLLDQEGWNE